MGCDWSLEECLFGRAPRPRELVFRTRRTIDQRREKLNEKIRQLRQQERAEEAVIAEVANHSLDEPDMVTLTTSAEHLVELRLKRLKALQARNTLARYEMELDGGDTMMDLSDVLRQVSRALVYADRSLTRADLHRSVAQLAQRSDRIGVKHDILAHAVPPDPDSSRNSGGGGSAEEVAITLVPPDQIVQQALGKMAERLKLQLPHVPPGSLSVEMQRMVTSEPVTARTMCLASIPSVDDRRSAPV